MKRTCASSSEIHTKKNMNHTGKFSTNTACRATRTNNKKKDTTMSCHTAHTDHGARSVLVQEVHTDTMERQSADDDKVTVSGFVCTFRRSARDHERKVAIMTAADSVNNLCGKEVETNLWPREC